MDYSQLGKKRNMRKQNPHTTRVRNKISLLALRVFLAAILIAGFAAFGAGMGLYFGILSNSPQLELGMVISEYRTSFIVSAHTGEVLQPLHAGHNHESVTMDQIPSHVYLAFVAIEDERFFEHNGIDIRGIGRAAHRLITSGGAVTEGASTITQQLIKNMLGHFESDFITKLQEQYMAINFERHLTEYFDGDRMAAKYFILESYLNIINLGRSTYGVQAAARFYYDLDVWDLSIVQAATIAAITQNPSRFPPDIRPDANWVRAQHVLDSMLRLGFITPAEHYEAINFNVYDTIVRTEGGDIRSIISPFDCFTDALLDDVLNDLMREFNWTRDMANRVIFSGGITIYSTQDLEMQAVVDRVFLDENYWPEADFAIEVEFNFSLYNSVTNQTRHYRINRIERTMEDLEAWIDLTLNQHMTSQDEVIVFNPLFTPQPQAAFVLLDHSTGHVAALRGVRGERGANRTFNRATHSTRSPGSQMKPIAVFGPAFDMGIMQPASIIDDIPFTLVAPSGTWTPRQWWSSQNLVFEGASSARRAVYRSMNVVSARAAADPAIPHVGVDAMFNYLERMGITTLVRGSDGPAISLGGLTRGLRLVELAGAYGMVANGGMFNRPVLYTRVVGPNGEILLDNTPNPVQVFRDTAAYLLLDTMRDTMTQGDATGHAANWTNVNLRGMDTAGKTGTSQNRADLGFSGSTPYFTASIWMGHDNNQSLSNSRAHLIAWRSIMQEIHLELEHRRFERPSGIVTATVCRDSGMVMTDLCHQDPRGGRGRTDIFDARFVPAASCTVHQEFTFCEEHGYLAGPYCESWGTVVTRVGLVRTVPILDIRSGVTIRDSHVEFPQRVLEGLICPYHFFHNPNAGQEAEDPWANWQNPWDLPPNDPWVDPWNPPPADLPSYWDDHDDEPEPNDDNSNDGWGGESIPVPDPNDD